jgi:WD40 repeat protein
MSLTVPGGAVYSILLLRGGKIVAGCKDKKLRVWEGSSHTPREKQGHTGSVLCLSAYGSDDYVSGSSDGTLIQWKDGKVLYVMSGHEDSVLSVASLTDGRIVSARYYLITYAQQRHDNPRLVGGRWRHPRNPRRRCEFHRTCIRIQDCFRQWRSKRRIVGCGWWC